MNMAIVMTTKDLLPFTSLPPRTFETERLILRALEPTDAQVMFDLWASDPVATRYMSFKCTGRIEDTQSFVDSACRYARGEPSPNKHFTWLMTLKGSGEVIGSVGYGPKNEFCLVGGYILTQAYWGKGYATEGWKCIVDYAKAQPGVFRIEASHDADNPASGKVLEKSGLSFEGILKRSSIHPNVSDEPRDSYVYAWARP